MSRTAFYAWAAKAADPSPRELEEAYLLNEIIDLHDLDDTYGRPRMTVSAGDTQPHRQLASVPRWE